MGNRRKDITDFRFYSVSKVFRRGVSLFVVYIITVQREPNMNYRHLTKNFLFAKPPNFANVFVVFVVYFAQDCKKVPVCTDSLITSS